MSSAFINLQNFTVFNSVKASNVIADSVSTTACDSTNLSTYYYTKNIPVDISANPATINLTAIDTKLQYGLGTKYEANGNTYRYCQVAVNPWPAAGGGIQPVSFQAHNLVGCYPTAQVAVTNITLSSMVSGSFTVTVVSPSNVTANQFQNWYFYNENGSYGEDNVVASHPAAGTGQPLVLTLSYPNTQNGVGPVGLVQNPWLLAPYNLDGAATQLPVGVILVDMFAAPASFFTGYVWVQTKGYCSVKQAANVGGNIAILKAGDAVYPASGGNTDTNVGRVCAILEAVAAKIPPQLGICVVAPSGSDEMAFVNLNLE